ncbi:hypothetical protein K503DRAFT_726912 [Rhizopogon vinicolor AM-OR11-026]|uniref:Uncharacterized protein n=1 Tax=Rhizopogon vinicolor AM-OR11-026 TaxID=1314800 RepID=A0A1B7MIV0_9AGAM|nr:hypothetical protein K503DRAFT_726912 [Rhizopogon vinicolor AM-OR11-026]
MATRIRRCVGNYGFPQAQRSRSMSTRVTSSVSRSLWMHALYLVVVGKSKYCSGTYRRMCSLQQAVILRQMNRRPRLVLHGANKRVQNVILVWRFLASSERLLPLHFNCMLMRAVLHQLACMVSRTSSIGCGHHQTRRRSKRTALWKERR